MNALNILGLKIYTKEWDKKNQLPIYILNSFDVNKVIINDIECLSLTPIDKIPTISAIKKYFNILKDIENIPVLLYLDSLSTFRKENLLSNHIPFILKDKMVFLPFMTTLLTNYKYDYNSHITKLTISAQLLFIWILYQDTDKYFISDALEFLDFSNMTLTRAYRQLCSTKLFKEGKSGRKIYLSSNFDKLELFNQMKPFLISPIYKQGYINKSDINEHMVLSGDLAFSKYSFINPPTINTYAIDKKLFNNINISDELYSQDDQVKLQIWYYNPLIFNKNGTDIDILSLIISLLDENDERIDMELDHFLDITL